MLGLEIVGCHSLDIAESCHRNDSILIGNKILRGDLIVKADRGFSLVPVFIADGCSLVPYYSEKNLLISENSLVFLDLFHELGILCLELFSFQTCQLP